MDSDLYYWCNTDIPYSVKGRRSSQQLNAKGKAEVTFFSHEEICKVFDYMMPVMDIITTETNNNEAVEAIYSQETLVMNVESAIRNEGSSFYRILLLLQLARKTGFLSEKISWYCAVLECLFAIERNHKKCISEMTAAFVAEKEQEKAEIIQNMRDAYKIRSEFVHGSVVSLFKNNAEMAKLSEKTDEYVRIALRKAFSDSNYKYVDTTADKKRVREYFTK